MTDNDDLRERVAKQPIMQAFMRAILAVEPDEADRLKTAMNDMEPDPRMGPLMDALDAEWTALSATPIEALQQRVERLEVALRGIAESDNYVGVPIDSEAANHFAMMVQDWQDKARAALGDDVG